MGMTTPVQVRRAQILGAIREQARIVVQAREGAGVEIKLLQKLAAYTPGEALAWAIEHKMALALDKRMFETLALANQVDFVKPLEKKEAQAQISGNLGNVLEKEGSDD